MIDAYLGDHGLSSLFFLSFLASTLLPLGSEWLLALLIAEGMSSFIVILVATIGNFLGSFTTYLIGRWGADFMVSRMLRINDFETGKAKRIYRRWGIWSLLFSWMPIVGDPLCLAAGIFKASPVWFSMLVNTGKCFRYVFVAWVVFSAKVG